MIFFGSFAVIAIANLSLSMMAVNDYIHNFSEISSSHFTELLSYLCKIEKIFILSPHFCPSNSGVIEFFGSNKEFSEYPE